MMAVRRLEPAGSSEAAVAIDAPKETDSVPMSSECGRQRNHSETGKWFFVVFVTRFYPYPVSLNISDRYVVLDTLKHSAV